MQAGVLPKHKPLM